MALAAPALVRASSIMPVRDPKLVRGILIHKNGRVLVTGVRSAQSETLSALYCRGETADQSRLIPWESFEPLPEGKESLRHETVWLHESDRRVVEFRQIEKQSAVIAKPAYELSLEERAARPRPRQSWQNPKIDRRRSTSVDARAAVRAHLPTSYIVEDGNLPMASHRNYGGLLLPASAYDPRYALDAA